MQQNTCLSRKYSTTSTTKGTTVPNATAIFTICSNNYMPYARTLLASVARYHPEADLFLGLADERIASDTFYPANVEILPARELGIPDFPSFAFQYDILEFNTAIKPFLFLEIFSRSYQNVIYLDPDILLFRPLISVLDALADGASFVLTPHLCTPAERFRTKRSIYYARRCI